MVIKAHYSGICPRCYSAINVGDSIEAWGSRTVHVKCPTKHLPGHHDQQMHGGKLAVLEGSEKQVGWATDIRERMLTKLVEKRRDVSAQIEKIESRPAGQQTIHILLAILPSLRGW